MVYVMKTGRVEQSGHPDEVYKKGGVYKDIIDASARSLNIHKIARTIGGTDGGVSGEKLIPGELGRDEVGVVDEGEPELDLVVEEEVEDVKVTSCGWDGVIMATEGS